MLSGIRSIRPLPEGKRRRETCGEGGIRTLDTDFGPYNGLANRRLRPLGHLSRMRRPSSTVLSPTDKQCCRHRRPPPFSPPVPPARGEAWDLNRIGGGLCPPETMRAEPDPAPALVASRGARGGVQQHPPAL